MNFPCHLLLVHCFVWHLLCVGSALLHFYYLHVAYTAWITVLVFMVQVNSPHRHHKSAWIAVAAKLPVLQIKSMSYCLVAWLNSHCVSLVACYILYCMLMWLCVCASFELRLKWPSPSLPVSDGIWWNRALISKLAQFSLNKYLHFSILNPSCP